MSFAQTTLPHLQFKLLSVFGMEMCELEVGTAKEKEYVLLNALPTALREGCHINDRELPSFSLAMVILALLHLSDGEMKESKSLKLLIVLQSVLLHCVLPFWYSFSMILRRSS